LAVYALNEQVISTASLLQSLSSPHRRHIYRYDVGRGTLSAGLFTTGDVTIEARATVLTAGVGNARLLRAAGIEQEMMQRRPLNMVLLRGALPPLFAHCVAGGKTQLTITAPAPGIWQVGGEIAERLAHEADPQAARRQALGEIARWIPALNLDRIEIALYYAVRAEARSPDLRRPSGVHARYVGPKLLVAWPTKLSLTPVLADEVFALVDAELKSPAKYDAEEPLPWPTPFLARYPWEEAEWFSVA
jgi:hypothetical protein